MGNVSTQVQDVKEIPDWRLFQTQVGHRLTERIMRLKHSYDPMGLDLGGSNLDGNASRRLGEILSQNESIKALKISGNNININVTELLAGLQRNLFVCIVMPNI